MVRIESRSQKREMENFVFGKEGRVGHSLQNTVSWVKRGRVDSFDPPYELFGLCDLVLDGFDLRPFLTTPFDLALFVLAYCFEIGRASCRERV